MNIRWLARLLIRWARWYVRDKKPNFEVMRDGGRDVYLRRWWITPRNGYMNIYLHNMLKDDDDILHDHMYWSFSLCLDGWLVERYRPSPPSGDYFVRDVVQGSVTIRSSTMAHQLIVKIPAWTIFITGPRIKEWGFWCPKGFRHWRDYVALNQDPSVDKSKIGTTGTSGRGVGCGEME